MKKKIIKYVITIIILGCIGLFFYSYIGIDKETGVPKGLLMRIRPLPWEEIYWDEDKQLLKLTVEDETFEGEESRCLRIYELTSGGLLMGGREFNHQEAASRVDARLEYTIEDQILTVRDKKHSKELFWMKMDDIVEDVDSITGIKAGPVYYDLGEDLVFHVMLGYQTEDDATLKYFSQPIELSAIVSYKRYDNGIELYTIEPLCWNKMELPDEAKRPNIQIHKDLNNQYLIEILDDGYGPKLPVQMSIPVALNEDGNLLRTGEVSCETKTAGKYDSVTVYLDDQSETTKFVWITINGLEVFSDADQFVRRMNFEYELMFKFDTESLEIFDIQKSGNNQVGL